MYSNNDQSLICTRIMTNQNTVFNTDSVENSRMSIKVYLTWPDTRSMLLNLNIHQMFTRLLCFQVCFQVCFDKWWDETMSLNLCLTINTLKYIWRSVIRRKSSSLMHRVRFWNNLHQVRSVIRLESQIF